MKRRFRIGALLLSLLTIACIVWIFPISRQSRNGAETGVPAKPAALRASTPVSTSTAAPVPASSDTEQREKAVANILGMFRTDIEFYGRVVDQNGEPVPFADIGYGAADKFNASGSDYIGQSDANGYFGISGIKGAALSVFVKKEGYYDMGRQSYMTFGYGAGSDSHRKVPPTKAHPAKFTLWKMGEVEPLVAIPSRTFRVPRDGRPVTVSLTTGRMSESGDLKVEAWTDDQDKNAEGHYDWRVQLSVPGGGIQKRSEGFNFEAPVDGYKPSVELGMTKETKRWVPRLEQGFFLNLPNNRFARINFTMIAGGHHFFKLESHLNPEPGHRNLEYDPEKQASVR